ncbi:hypothetical protein PRUPE_4G065600 [Prunus persica]|uniref:Leucine-rich repeat-containing N-terminal plant-type domain-containing protein n=1 Tax=Prunus persica TaxID=3760 RepID=A0A251PGQ1_PRUPE|nr:hypothetical protein PRUPE_4G065600 [Prunus persica]
MEPPLLPTLLLLLLLLLFSTTFSASAPPLRPTPSPTSSPTPPKSTTPKAPSPTSSPTPKTPSPTSSPTPPKSTTPKTPSPISSPTPPNSSTPKTPSSPSSSSLDPKQLRALQSLNIPTSKDPCTQPSLLLPNTTLCDSSKPFRHILSLRLANCSDDVALSFTALKSLSTLQSLQFFKLPHCPYPLPGRSRLVHVDLSSNQLNGTIPKFLSDMKSLKHLNLANNDFHGVVPFNVSFINKLAVFKISRNSNLCYNHSVLSSKLKLGISPCDKHGLPMSPPPAKGDSSAEDSSDSDYDDSDGDDSDQKKDRHHGPSKVVLGVAIGLSSIVFLIIFLVLLSKWCG